MLSEQSVRIDEKNYVVTIKEENDKKSQLIFRFVKTVFLIFTLVIFYFVFQDSTSFSDDVLTRFFSNKTNLFFYAILGIFVIYEVTRSYSDISNRKIIELYDYLIKVFTVVFLSLSVFLVQLNIVLDSIDSYKNLESKTNKKNDELIDLSNQNSLKTSSIHKELEDYKNKLDKLNIELNQIKEELKKLQIQNLTKKSETP
ncbi:hypothetical protein ACOJTA_08420 [Malaciobacter sp. WC5094]